MAKKDWMIKESELDEDQIRVLMATHEKSCVVTGCAGSGKSVLALIKAQRIQTEKGNNYKIITYTRALCDYMQAGKEFLELHNDLQTYKEWEKQNYPSADYIIVDEIQDFNQEEIKHLLTATNKYYFFFGDTSQSIYETLKANIIPIEDLRILTPINNKPKNWELFYNYRLPKSVAKIAHYIGIDLDPTNDEEIERKYKSTETTIPKIIQYTNTEKLLKSIINILKHTTSTDIGILFQTNIQVKAFCYFLKEFKLNYETRYQIIDKNGRLIEHLNTLNFNTTNPKVMTFHSAKGLQFETIILLWTGFKFNDKRQISEQKALYVAMTRTYKDLYIAYIGDLPHPLSQIPTHLYITSEIEEEIKDL